MKEIRIENKYEGLLLKKYLSEVLNYSRRQITRLYTSRLIFINGENKNLTYELKANDILTIELDSKLEAKIALSDNKANILYIDDYLVIVDKPAGLCAHQSAEHPKDNLATILEKQLNKKVYPTGRLDKNVSGLMLYALSKESASKLNKLREDNKLNKYYECIVKGNFGKKKDRLVYYLNKDKKTHKYIEDVNGKKCITDYETLKENKGFSLLKIHILTGRSHQIRAGLASYNHPLIGDHLYYKNDNRISRVALHASCLEFKHPYSNKDIKIECPLPKELENLIKEN